MLLNLAHLNFKVDAELLKTKQSK